MEYAKRQAPGYLLRRLAGCKLVRNVFAIGRPYRISLRVRHHYDAFGGCIKSLRDTPELASSPQGTCGFKHQKNAVYCVIEKLSGYEQESPP
jgi:hypothetical protein